MTVRHTFMKGIHLQTTLNVTIRDGKRKITAHIAIVDIKNYHIIDNITIEVDNESELDDVYNRLELLYSLTREEL